jgi:hypothetical protein
MRTLRRVVLLLAISALVLASGAWAIANHPPPKGKYGCALGPGGEYAGDAYILDGSHYRLNKSKVGVFITHGRSLTFKTGVWHGLFRGKWMVDSAHRPQIALTELSNGFTAEYCEREGAR